MPSWKKVIVSGSDATLNSVAASSQITVGTGITASTENTLILGAPPAAGSGEGGQLVLQSGPGYTSGSHIDNWQNQLRILRGTNAATDAVVANFNLHTKQIQFPAYNSTTAFTGTVAGLLAFDSSGNILTTSGGGGGSGTVNGGTAGYVAYYPSSGTTVDDSGIYWDSVNSRMAVGNTSPAYKVDVSGDIRATGAVYANANGAMYFQGGDDVALYDINIANHLGVYGQQDSTVGSIKLGSGGGVISGKSGNIGIGAINPTYKLDVSASSNSDGIRIQNAGASRFIFNGDGVALWGGASANGGQLTWDTGKAIVMGQSGYALSLGSNGTWDKMYINTSGDVLVGTTTSIWTTSGRGLIQINGTSQALLGLTVGGSSAGYLYHDGTNLDVWNGLNGYMRFGTNNTERMRIGADGNVSITGSLTVSVGITGSLQGNASTATSATNATNATNTAITDTTTGAGPYYLTFVSSTSGNQAQRVDSTGLTYNATSNAITASYFRGALVGNADTATTANNVSWTDSAASTLAIATSDGTSAYYDAAGDFRWDGSARAVYIGTGGGEQLNLNGKYIEQVGTGLLNYYADRHVFGNNAFNYQGQLIGGSFDAAQDITCGGTKYFDIPHQSKPGWGLKHGAIEGPESAVYFRGKLNNSNVIEFPEYWEWLVHSESITVSLTPIGSFQPLYVAKIENNQAIIASNDQPINCHFVVYGERKDVDRWEVEYAGYSRGQFTNPE